MKVAAAPGDSLAATLPAAGVEFPCGGAGTCGGCRVRVVEGALAITPEMQRVLTGAELAAGWRLACCARVEQPVTLEVGQWTMPVLSDDLPARTMDAEPRAAGIGMAVDLGTTTIAAQAIDLATGEVLEAATGLNPQEAHGADVMTRIEFALVVRRVDSHRPRCPWPTQGQNPPVSHPATTISAGGVLV